MIQERHFHSKQSAVGQSDSTVVAYRVSMVLVGSRSDVVTYSPRSTSSGHSGRVAVAEEEEDSNIQGHDAVMVEADEDSIGDCWGHSSANLDYNSSVVEADKDRVNIGFRRCMVNFDYLLCQRNSYRLLKETINEKEKKYHRDYETMHQLMEMNG